MATVLTIAGSDPSGGAGIQADIKTIEYFNVRALSVITAITAQTEERVFGVHPVAADLLTQQLYSATRSAEIDSVKIGMIGSLANVHAIVMFLRSMKFKNVVLDPVFISTSGAPLLESNALKVFKNELMPLATVITPNLSEAETLTGMHIWNLGTMKEAASKIFDETYQMQKDKAKQLSVLIKGGHLQGDSIDLLYDGKKFTEFQSPRIEMKKSRGTGCRLSSAIASNLSNGFTLEESIRAGKKFVESYISGE